MRREARFREQLADRIHSVVDVAVDPAAMTVAYTRMVPQ
jgi:hypothetical protein